MSDHDLLIEFEAYIDGVTPRGEVDQWRVVVIEGVVHIERWGEPDALGVSHWAEYSGGSGYHMFAILRRAMVALASRLSSEISDG